MDTVIIKHGRRGWVLFFLVEREDTQIFVISDEIQNLKFQKNDWHAVTVSPSCSLSKSSNWTGCPPFPKLPQIQILKAKWIIQIKNMCGIYCFNFLISSWNLNFLARKIAILPLLPMVIMIPVKFLENTFCLVTINNYSVSRMSCCLFTLFLLLYV